MSFTQDELQAFNTILERRLAAHDREVEQAFDRRINALRRDFGQLLAAAQQEILRSLAWQLANQQNGLNATLNQKFDMQQKHVTQAVSQQAERGQQQTEELLDRVQGTQLLGIEQLIGQRLALPSTGEGAAHTDGDEHTPPPHIEAIEVQTDLPWEDLADVFGKLLDARFTALNESIQAIMRSWEQHFSVQLHNMRGQIQPYRGDMASVTHSNEILRGIEQLEQIVESMQVVMTTNHALLSNRLNHHQQLPLERAHPSSHAHPTSLNGMSNPLSLPGEHDDH
jgi:exonuclease VII large subunit